MKLSGYKYVLLAAFSLLAACCGRIDVDEPENLKTETPGVAVPGTVTLRATIEQGGTRAFVGAGKFLYWNDGDDIWINGDTYTLSVEDGMATIENVRSAECYLAVYPASIAGAFDPSHPSSAQLTFPETQKYAVVDGAQVQQLPLLAYEYGMDPVTGDPLTPELRFSNVGSVLRVNINNDKNEQVLIHSITITPESASESVTESFSGSCEINGGYICPVTASSLVSGETRGVTLELGSSAPLMNTGDICDFDIAVPTLSSSKLSVKVNAYTPVGKIYSFDRTTPSEKSLEVNSIGSIPVSLNQFIEDFTVYFDGQGTDEDPYIISTPTQLQRLKELVDASNPMARFSYKLGCDIDFGGETFYSIGAWDRPFFGKFDGDGHRISNVVLGRTYFNNGSFLSSYYGLFGWVEGASFKNVTVQGTVNITKLTEFASIFCAAEWDSDFSGIVTEGEIITSGSDGYVCGVGPVLACAHRTYQNKYVQMKDCTNKARVSVTSKNSIACTGGIIGYCICGVQMTGCVNEGDIGLFNPDGSIVNISASGGLVGRINPGASEDFCEFLVDRCRNTGTIYVRADEDCCAGGAFGLVFDVDDDKAGIDPLIHVSNFVNSGDVTAISTDNDDAWAGGAVGYMKSDGPEIYFDERYYPYYYNCLNTGIIYAEGNDARCGGMGGYVIDTDTHFILCVNTGLVGASGDPHCGAISGGTSSWTADGGTAISCYWIDNHDNPVLPCIYDDADGDGYCAAYPTLGQDTLNNRRCDGNILNNSNTRWSAAQWNGTAAGMVTACPWTGRYSGLNDHDLDIVF